MYSGKLIDDLFALAERAQAGPRTSGAEPPAHIRHGTRSGSESEKFAQSLRLGPADWYLGLLLIVHAQLVRALEPRDDFSNAIGVHQVGTVRPPKQIRV